MSTNGHSPIPPCPYCANVAERMACYRSLLRMAAGTITRGRQSTAADEALRSDILDALATDPDAHACDRRTLPGPLDYDEFDEPSRGDVIEITSIAEGGGR